MRNRRGGFTLVELITYVGIIGVVSVIVAKFVFSGMDLIRSNNARLDALENALQLTRVWEKDLMSRATPDGSIDCITSGLNPRVCPRLDITLLDGSVVSYATECITATDSSVQNAKFENLGGAAANFAGGTLTCSPGERPVLTRSVDGILDRVYPQNESKGLGSVVGAAVYFQSVWRMAAGLDYPDYTGIIANFYYLNRENEVRAVKKLQMGRSSLPAIGSDAFPVLIR